MCSYIFVRLLFSPSSHTRTSPSGALCKLSRRRSPYSQRANITQAYQEINGDPCTNRTTSGGAPDMEESIKDT